VPKHKQNDILGIMKDVIQELGSLILGEITADSAARDYFATDGSVFTIKPQVVIYPKTENDVVLAVKYLEAKAKAGEKINLTARGKGTDQGGGALGDGAVLVLPAHLKRFVRMSKGTITVEPGMIYAQLQGTLKSHGRWLPPYPASMDFATIGGAVANNSAGEKTIKYGSTRDYVTALRVVLSNGDVISTRRLNRRELAAKKRQDDFEGHLYRELDDLLKANKQIISTAAPLTSKNSAGYDLWDVKGKGGSFDLSQLIVGSQGTLGVVTQATLRTEKLNAHTILLTGFFESVEAMAEAVDKIMPLGPSALEVVDYHLLKFLRDHHNHVIDGLIPEKLPAVALLVEFDDHKQARRLRKAHKVAKVFHELTYQSGYATDPDEQAALWKIRRSAAAVIWMYEGPKKALPIIEDGAVPLQHMPEFLREAYKLFDKYKIQTAVWGHAGNANFHLQPFLDLSNFRDRKKVFELMDDFYKLVIRLGGTTCGEHNDGLIRGPYLKKLYGAEIFGLFKQVKELFDPENFLNPGVKVGATIEEAQVHLRREYSMKHLHDFFPSLSHTKPKQVKKEEFL
jgi:FAD/FMN-containing dehydrogenase